MRYLACFACLVFVSAVSGCAICPPGYLDDYATVGGKWQRSDPTRGRVGSTLSDAGSTTHTSPAFTEGSYYGPPAGERYQYESGYVDPNYNGDVYAPDNDSRSYVNEAIDPNVYGPAEQYSTAPRYSDVITDGSTNSNGGGVSILENGTR